MARVQPRAAGGWATANRRGRWLSFLVARVAGNHLPDGFEDETRPKPLQARHQDITDTEGVDDPKWEDHVARLERCKRHLPKLIGAVGPVAASDRYEEQSEEVACHLVDGWEVFP